MKAAVFREFEVAVRPEPPPLPVAPDGRTAEDTLVGKMGLGDGGAPGWAGSVSVGVFAAMTESWVPTYVLGNSMRCLPL